MPVQTDCPECGKKYRFPDDLAGATVDCKSCGAEIEVPGGARRRSSGGSKKGRKKSQSSAGVLIGVGVGSAVVCGIIAFLVVSNLTRPAVQAQPVAQTQPDRQSPPAGMPPAVLPPVAAAAPPAAPASATPPAAPGNPAVAAAPKAPAAGPGATPSGFQPAKTTEESPRLVFKKSADWTVQADPPAAIEEFKSEKPLKIKVEGRNLRNDAVLYPVASSPFVGIKSDIGSKSPFEIYNLTTGGKAGTVTGISASNDLGLSPDGKYLAMASPGSKTITVFDVKAKKPLGELTVTDASTRFQISTLALPRPDRLVALSQVDRGVKVWELPSGNFVQQIVGDKNFQPEPFHAFSPGGRYLAVNGEFLLKRLELYDLETGKLAGAIEIDGKAHSLDFGAFGFSPDGSELAVIYNVSARAGRGKFSQFVVWNLATGQIVDDFDIEPDLKEQLDPGYQKERLEPFPGGRRWLAHSRGIIDRDAKQLVFSYPKIEGADLNVARKVMGADWLVGVEVGKGDSKLEVLKLDDEKLAKGAAAAAAGGMAIDLDLPPLTPADFADASEAIASNDWTAKPDAGIDVPALKSPLALEATKGVLRDVVLGRGANPVAAVRIAIDEDLDDPKVKGFNLIDAATRERLAMKPPKPIAKETQVDTYGLADGKRTGRIKAPFSADLCSISPDGGKVLLELHRGEGRLDIYSLAGDGSHVLGWRPFQTASEERERQLASAEFVDDDHVVTHSQGDQLVVWKISGGLTPVLKLADARRYAVSPGGKQLAVVRGNILGDKDLALFDVASGDGIGLVALEAKVAGMAFHPSGQWLALSQGSEANKLISVIDIAEGQVAARWPVPDQSEQLAWMGDDYLLLGGSQLISKPFQAVAWSYDPGLAVLARTQPGGKCWFALPVANKWQLRSAALPDGAAAGKLEGTSLAANARLKPGDKVALQVTIGPEPELSEMRRLLTERLTQRLAKSQLERADGAPTRVAVTVNVKSLGTANVSKIGNRSDQTAVTIKVINCRIAFEQGGATIWETERRFGNLDRLLIRLDQGEAPQAGIDRQMSEFAVNALGAIELPSYVFGSNARQGLGKSTLAAAAK